MQETDWEKALEGVLERRQLLQEQFENHGKATRWDSENTALATALDANLLAEIAVHNRIEAQKPKRSAKSNHHAKNHHAKNGAMTPPVTPL